MGCGGTRSGLAPERQGGPQLRQMWMSFCCDGARGGEHSGEDAVRRLKVLICARSFALHYSTCDPLSPWGRDRILMSRVVGSKSAPQPGQKRREVYLTSVCWMVLFLYMTCKLSIYSSTALVHLGRFFSFLIVYTVGRTPCTGDQPVARPLPAHRLNAHRHPCPNVRAGEVGWCLRPRRHCGRHVTYNTLH
jgi:hypothetical protein